MLNESQLCQLEEDLSLEFKENLLHIISKLNRENRLNDFLDLIGLTNLVEDDGYRPFKTGKIIIAGESEISKEIILAIAKNYNISKDRIELCLSYDEATNYNFKKTYYNPNYSLIMVGPMGHSGHDKDNYSSVITALENIDGYPPIVRLGTNSLKITKSGLRETFYKVLNDGIISSF